MKTKIIVIVCAAVVTAACGGNCGNKNSGHADEKECFNAEEVKKIISAQVFIKAEKVDDFLAATRGLIEKSRAEEGCISYSLYQDPEDKTRFLFFEEWKNQAAIDFHFATEHFQQFGTTLEDCASKPGIITVYDSIDEKKV